MLGIIGGTSLRFSDLPDLEKQTVMTPYGPAEVLHGNVIVLMRHQDGLPPHRINFRANVAALAIEGVDKVVAIGSVGSLKQDITPGSLLIPTDYISMGEIPSVHDHAIVHVRPEMTPSLTHALSSIIPEARLGGTYAQTRGPRIETIAEVKALSMFADVVGMTIASEATLARELGMPFTALCTVDNYANGLGSEVLTYDHILTMAQTYRSRTESIVKRIIKVLGKR